MFKRIPLLIFRSLSARWDKYRLSCYQFKYLGENVKVRGGFRFGHTENLELQDNIVIGEHAFINAHGGVLIKSGTITGPDIMIFSVNHVYDTDECVPFGEELSTKKVIIGENCWIGGKVFICAGVELGDGCVVAGGAVVTKSFPNYSIIGGNPAKVIKMRNVEKYEIAKSKFTYHSEITKR